MANELNDLKDAVAAIEGVVPSVTALIVGFAEYVKAHANDPVAIKDYANRVIAQATQLADAAAANPLPE